MTENKIIIVHSKVDEGKGATNLRKFFVVECVFRTVSSKCLLTLRHYPLLRINVHYVGITSVNCTSSSVYTLWLVILSWTVKNLNNSSLQHCIGQHEYEVTITKSHFVLVFNDSLDSMILFCCKVVSLLKI